MEFLGIARKFPGIFNGISWMFSGKFLVNFLGIFLECLGISLEFLGILILEYSRISCKLSWNIGGIFLDHVRNVKNFHRLFMEFCWNSLGNLLGISWNFRSWNIDGTCWNFRGIPWNFLETFSELLGNFLRIFLVEICVEFLEILWNFLFSWKLSYNFHGMSIRK